MDYGLPTNDQQENARSNSACASGVRCQNRRRPPKTAHRFASNFKSRGPRRPPEAGFQDDATALAVAAFVITVLSKDHEPAFGAIERALSLNPSCATALYFAALMYSFAGRPADAISNANRALRLSPFDPALFQAHMALGYAALQEARYNEAALHLAKAVQANPRMAHLYFRQAESLALTGRLQEARRIAQRGLELFPGWRIGLLAAFGLSPAITDKIIEGARLLGLPE